MAKLNVGKLPAGLLDELLASMEGADDPDVIIGPRIGEDAAVIRVGDRVIAVHVDPITEANIGSAKLSVIVASNDVAVTGVKPRWALIVMLLPENSSWSQVKKMAKEIGMKARELGISIVGGHTEISPGITKPIIITTVIGETAEGRFIPTRGAVPGDFILQVRAAALEGTYIIATDFKEKLLRLGVGRATINRALEFINELSVIEPALKLSALQGTHSMHDPTEGGLIGGLLELAIASNTTLRVHKNRFIVRPETLEITRVLDLDWAKLISSGTLIVAISPEELPRLPDVLDEYEYAIIGRVEHRGECPLIIEDVGECINEAPRDEISRLWER